MSVFTPDFLDALDDWLFDTSLDKEGKAARLTSLARALPTQFRTVNGPVYRRIDLKKHYVTILGAYVALEESTSSWTADLVTAQKISPVPFEPNLGFVFERRPASEEIILNIEALANDSDFQAAQSAYGPGRGGFDYMRSEQEVLLRVERVSLANVASIGTRPKKSGPTWLNRERTQKRLRQWLKKVDTLVAIGQPPEGVIVGGWVLGERTLVDLRPEGAKYPIIVELDGGRLVCREGLRLALLEGAPEALDEEATHKALTNAGVALTDASP